MNETTVKVLLIEDDHTNAQLTERILEAEGRGEFSLEWTPSLAAGLKRLDEGGIDLILLDLGLPDSEGAHTFDRINACAPNTPVVLLTGDADEELALQLVQRGAQEYLVKGQVDGQLLVRCLRHALERQHLITALQDLSLVDDLTGLHNRRGFMALAYQQQRIADRRDEPLFVIYADLDNMKWINDTLGHHIGDQALTDVAEVLEQTFRKSDIVARLGGDEFVIMLTEARDRDIEPLKYRLRDNLMVRGLENERPYELEMSIGVARYRPNTGSTIDDLMEEADELMYEQKKKRKAS